MPDYTNLMAAQDALANPATTPADLALIAQYQPALRAAVAGHPRAYPGLLEWLASSGDPQVLAAVAARRQYDAQGAPQPPAHPEPAPQPYAASAPAPEPQPSAPVTPEPAPQPYAAMTPAPEPQPYTPSAPVTPAPEPQPYTPSAPAPQPYTPAAPSAGQPYVPTPPPSYAPTAPQVSWSSSPSGFTAPATPGPQYAAPGYQPSYQGQPPAQPPRKHRRWPAVAAAVVAVVAVGVAAVLTRGFGLMPSGGAATPDEAAITTANALVAQVNSLTPEDVKKMLTDPASYSDGLRKLGPPSEQHLASTLDTAATFNISEILALQPDTISIISDSATSFHIEAKDLKTSAKAITPDVSKVTFTAGTVTVTADKAKLRAALEKSQAAASAQLAATAEKYGVTITKDPLADAFPDGWVDQAMTNIEKKFPYTIDLANPDTPFGPVFVMTVQENGSWYVSPTLTVDEYQLVSRAGQDGVDDARGTSVPEPAKHATATEAAKGLVDAIAATKGNDFKTLAAELPLAERRSFALYGATALSATGIGNMETATATLSDAKFSTIKSNDTQERLRIDNLTITVDTGQGDPLVYTITDGTCLAMPENPLLGTPASNKCLKDALDETTVRAAFQSTLALSGTTPDGLQTAASAAGFEIGDLIQRAEDATVAAAKAVQPDNIGIDAIKESDGWHVSLSTTVSDLGNQLLVVWNTWFKTLAVK